MNSNKPRIELLDDCRTEVKILGEDEDSYRVRYIGVPDNGIPVWIKKERIDGNIAEPEKEEESKSILSKKKNKK